MSDDVISLQGTMRKLGWAFALLGAAFWVSALMVALVRLVFVVGGDPAEPWFLPVLFAVLGAPFAVLGIGFLAATTARSRRQRELRQHGQKLVARVVRTEPSAVRIQRRRALILVAQAQHPETGVELTFRSDALLLQADAWLGRDVTVWVDLSDVRRYVFDLLAEGSSPA